MLISLIQSHPTTTSSFRRADVRGLSNSNLVLDAFEQTQQSLLQYSLSFYPQVQVRTGLVIPFTLTHLFRREKESNTVLVFRPPQDKFGQMMALLPQLRHLTERGEEFLFFKHLNGSAPTQTLLMEMLHARRR